MTILWGDLETYSEVPLKHGTYKYAANAEITLFPYAIDDADVQVWDLTTGEDMPDDLAECLLDPDVLINFSNAMFDRTVLRTALNTTPILVTAAEAITRWRDTMVKALAHSLPGSLEKLCDIFKLHPDQAKLKDGKALINLFCKPRPVSSKIRRADRNTHPAEWERFKVYAANDVVSMRIIDGKIPNLNYPNVELAHWHLDQKINDRGVLIDLDFANAAIETANAEKARLAVECHAKTFGEVEAATKRDKLINHILEYYGVWMPDMQSSTLERRINDPDLPFEVRELLDIRLQASMGGVSKYKAMVNAVNADGRARGLLQFDGANRTGRWAGRTIQPQNMFRPPKYISREWEFAIDAIKSGVAPLIYDNVMEACSATTRGALIPPPGKKYVVADLSNIEGRDQAWLAMESWKLQAFRDFDTIIGYDENGKAIRKGHDLYKLAYAGSFGIRPEDVTEDQRQVGKVQELALGYGGGVGAFRTFAAAYGIDLEQMAVDALPTLPEDILEEAREFYSYCLKKKLSTHGLSEDAFVVCDAFKRGWRRAHPNIAAHWKELEDGFRAAMDSPGEDILVRRVSFKRSGSWLRIKLPSGRYLCYPSPQVSEKGELSYMGVNQYTRKWQRIKTYGGKLFENMCQALAAHVLKDAMPGIEDEGYEIVLTVHDETITEAPDTDEYNADALSVLLARNPVWAPDMPLAAAGFSAYRYRKG